MGFREAKLAKYICQERREFHGERELQRSTETCCSVHTYKDTTEAGERTQRKKEVEQYLELTKGEE